MIEKFSPSRRARIIKKIILAGLALVVPIMLLAAWVLFGLVDSSWYLAQAATGINKQINYQGKIADTNGVSVASGKKNFMFEIYDDPTAGSKLWEEAWTATTTAGAVTVTNGAFSTALGTSTAMNVDFNQNKLYLQVYFDANSDGSFEEVFSPRKRITAAPYAFNADLVDGLHATTTATAGQILALDNNVGISLTRASTSASLVVGTSTANYLDYNYGDLLVSGDAEFDGSVYLQGSTISSRNPTLAHAFSSWAIGAENSHVDDAVIYINPAAAAGDSNLLGLAVNGSVKFLVDAEGDFFANSMTLAGSQNVGTSNVSTLVVENNSFLGDAANSDWTGISGSAWINANKNLGTVSSTALVITQQGTGNYLEVADGTNYYDGVRYFTIDKTGTASTTKLVVAGSATTTGNLVLGTSRWAAPTSTLTVVGSGYFTGNLAVSGLATTTSRLVVGSANPANDYGKLWVGGDTYISGSATTTGALYVSEFASSTSGLYTQGGLHIGGTASFDGLVSGAGFDSAWNNALNGTSTWWAFGNRWNDALNATTTWAAFTANWNNALNSTTTWAAFGANWNDSFNNTSTWTAYDANWARNANATTTYPGFQGQFDTALNATTTLDLNSLEVGLVDQTTTSTQIQGGMIVDANTLVVNANENRVGIGTASPIYTLDVSGSIRSLDGYFVLQDTTNGQLQLVDNGLRSFQLSASSASLYKFGILNTASGGMNVGIGITNPTSTLDVFGTLNVSSNATTSGRLVVGSTNPTNNWGGLWVGGNGWFNGSATTTGTLYVNEFASTTKLWVGIDSQTTTSTQIRGGMIVDATTLVVNANEDKVGIGTANPYSLFDVYGSTPIITLSDSQQKTWSVGDIFGTLSFRSTDSSAGGARQAAYISALSDEAATTPSGVLVFGTSPSNTVASERMRITSTGYVGIGLSSPTSTLDVLGTLNVSSNATTSGRLVVGSTNPTNNWGGLWVGGNSWLNGSATTTGTLYVNEFASTTALYAGIVDQTTTSTQIRGGMIVDATTLVVNANEDRVGIGTASPATKLDVAGTISVGYNSLSAEDYLIKSAGYWTYLSTGAKYGIYMNPLQYLADADSSISTTGIYSAPQQTNYYTRTRSGAIEGVVGQPLLYTSSGATTILTGNVVGVRGSPAITSNTGAAATVSNVMSLYGSNPAKSGAGTTITNAYGLYLESITAGTNNYGVYSLGGINYFAGNVGIGTSTPTTKLHVYNSTDVVGDPSIAQVAYLQRKGSTAVTGLGEAVSLDFGFDWGASGTNYQTGRISARTHGSSWGSALQFFTSNNDGTVGGNLQERMIIDNAGKVGIGLSSPTSTLDVLGTLNVSSNATTSGRLVVGSTNPTTNDTLWVGGTAYFNGGATTTHTLYVTSYASSTGGLFTQGNGHYGGTLSVDDNLTFYTKAKGLVFTDGSSGTFSFYPHATITKRIDTTANNLYSTGAMTYGAIGDITLDAYNNSANSTIIVSNGAPTYVANMTIDGGLSVSSSATTTGRLVVGSTNPTNNWGGLWVGGNSWLNGSATTTGTLYVNEFASTTALYAGIVDQTTTSTQIRGGMIVDATTLVVNANEDRVGIGTASPYTILDVNGHLTLSGGNRNIENNVYYSGSWKYTANGVGWLLQTDNGGNMDIWSFLNNTSGAGAAASGSLRMTINNVSGYVGVNTTAPLATLNVSGTTLLGGNASTTGTLVVNATANSSAWNSATNTLTVVGSGYFTTNLRVSGNATTTGRLVVGSTNPTNNWGGLWVGGNGWFNGSATTTGTLYVNEFASTTALYAGIVDQTTTSTQIRGGMIVDATTLVVNANENSVGIGTASPASSLHVYDPGNTYYSSRSNVTFNTGNVYTGANGVDLIGLSNTLAARYTTYNSTNDVTGFYNYTYSSATLSGGTVGDFIGIDNLTYPYTGTVYFSNLYGIKNRVQMHYNGGGSATTTNAYIYYGSLVGYQQSGITNEYGAYLDMTSGSGLVITNKYGLYITGASGGTSKNYSIYAGSGQARFDNALATTTLYVTGGSFMDNSTTTRIVVGSTNPTTNDMLWVGGTAYLSGGATTTHSLYVTSYASSTGGFYTQGNSRFGGTLTVEGASSLTSLTVSGSATTTTRLVVGSTNPTNNYGKIWVGGDFYTSGNATTTGSLTVGSLNAASCDVKADTNGLLYCGTDATGVGTGSSNWQALAGAVNTLTPTSTSAGLFVYASSTFNSTLRVNGNATTSGNFTVGTSTLVVQNDTSSAGYGKVGIGVATPGNYTLDVFNSASTTINNARIGAAQLGSIPTSSLFANWTAFFGHQALDHSDGKKYALTQDILGNTILNAADDRTLTFTIGASSTSSAMTLYKGGFLGVATSTARGQLYVKGINSYYDGNSTQNNMNLATTTFISVGRGVIETLRGETYFANSAGASAADVYLGVGGDGRAFIGSADGGVGGDIYLGVGGDGSGGDDNGGAAGDIYMALGGLGEVTNGNDGTVTIGNRSGKKNATLNVWGVASTTSLKVGEDNIVMGTGWTGLVANTADGTDNSVVSILGGGDFTAFTQTTRGAGLNAYGNETYFTQPLGGILDLFAGNTTTSGTHGYDVGYISFTTGNAQRMLISNSGHIAIGGHSRATSTLDVLGTFRVSGNATTSGNLVVGTTLPPINPLPAGSLYVGGNATTTGSLTIGTMDTGGATANVVTITVGSSNLIAKTSSLRKYKTDIDYFGVDPAWVYGLQPVAYTWTSTGQKIIGFIAEDVALVESRFASHDENGNVSNVEWNAITASLVAAVKEQNQSLDQLNDQMALLQQTANSSSTPPLAVIDNPDLDIQTLAVRQAADFYGTITVYGGAKFVSKVTFKDHVYFDKDAAGVAKIISGATSTEVVFEKEYEWQPIITATPKSNLVGRSYWVFGESKQGFHIAVDPVFEADFEFNWHALAVEGYEGQVAGEEEAAVFGCADPIAENFNPLATRDDGSCAYPVLAVGGGDDDGVFGCMDAAAENFNPLATQSDNSCVYAATESESSSAESAPTEETEAPLTETEETEAPPAEPEPVVSDLPSAADSGPDAGPEPAAEN